MAFHPRRFDRAARSYDGASGVQAAMARSLVGLLPGGFRPAGPILEMGCGTGHLTRLLRDRFPGTLLVATDAAPRMLEAVAAVPGIAAAIFDAEGPAAAPGAVTSLAPYGLLASNALVQWFPDLEAHLRLAAGLLAPGGTYLVSGFRRDNFPELNALLAAEPFGHRDFPGHQREEAERAMARAGFAVEAMGAEEREEAFPDARAFLDRIRGLGASRRPAEGRPLTRASLERLVKEYRERYPSGEGVRATWRTWSARLRR